MIHTIINTKTGEVKDFKVDMRLEPSEGRSKLNKEVSTVMTGYCEKLVPKKDPLKDHDGPRGLG